MPSAKIKAVLFDLGGTLMQSAFGPPEVIRRILEAYGVNVPLHDITEAHEANVREFDSEELVNSGQAYWTNWNFKILKRLNIQENNELLAKKIGELWWKYDKLEVYPDTVETLIQLKNREIKTGIVTNSPEKDFTFILQNLSLTSYFDEVVGIDACKKAKPDKEIFLYAVNRLHVYPEETLFVGDSLKFDYEGAEKAGLKPLLIDRDERFPDMVNAIKSLVEVLQHV